ncbi:MAG: efflux RND transporter periplasmic adaptor subunit [Phycisphaerales bacterium]|nr:efflux RND transporter periplasmic adaptor subunit [Phycisphaerales bacterium]
MWKWLLGIFIVLAVGCGVGGFFASKSEPVKKMLKQMRGEKEQEPVRVESVVRGDLTRTIAAPGAIDAKTKVKINARVSAKIIALPFKEGETVKEGDVLVRLDAEDLKASLDEAKAGLRADEARLEGAQASLGQLRLELERIRKLHATKDRSDSDLESAEASFLQAQSALRASEQSIERSRATVRRAERDIENTIVTSPMAGVITKLNSEVGEVVLGTFQNAGTVIMEIADLNTMLMRAEVDENNIEPIKPGQKATVYINAYPDRKLAGIVERLKEQNQISREGKQYFEAEVLLDLTGLAEGQRLRTGLKANCDIQVETKFGVMKVPSQAVLDRRIDELPEEIRKSPIVAGKSKAFARVVYRLIDGKAVATPVETGSSDITSTVILSGLDEQSRVITGPYKVLSTLKDGAAVREDVVKPEAAPPTAESKPAAEARRGG